MVPCELLDDPQWRQLMLSAHHALRIAEILENIFSFLTKKELFNLAMACRAFEDCALNALWGGSEISIEIMLQPLKAANIIHNLKDGRLLPHCLSRPPSAKEFSRFVSYIRRIKCLNWNAETMHPSLVDDMFGTLFKKPQTQLPRLSKLTYTQVKDDDMGKCLYFMTGFLKNLTLYPRPTEELSTWSRCLSTLPTRCPGLTALGLYFKSSSLGSSRAVEVEQLLGGVLFSLPHLQTILLFLPDGVSRPFFQKLGHVPMLKCLAISTSRGLHPSFRENQPTPSFCHLERLLVGPIGNDLALGNLRDHIRPILQGYSESCSSQPLLKVIVIMPFIVGPSAEFVADVEHRVTLSHLTPLFKSCYRSLERLEIKLPLSYDLIDSDLTLLGGQLPNLIILSLAHVTGDVMKDWPIPRATLHGLIALTSRCPRLKSLALAVNLFTMPSLSQPPKFGVNYPAPELCIWNVANSHIQDAEAVAITLARWLPGLVDMREMGFSWVLLGKEGQREPGYSFSPLECSDPWAKRSRDFSIMGRFFIATRTTRDKSPRALHLLWTLVAKRWEETEARKKEETEARKKEETEARKKEEIEARRKEEALIAERVQKEAKVTSQTLVIAAPRRSIFSSTAGLCVGLTGPIVLGTLLLGFFFVLWS